LSLEKSTFSDSSIFSRHLLLARLIVKVPRPGDSEVTFADFESNCHLLVPV